MSLFAPTPQFNENKKDKNDPDFDIPFDSKDKINYSQNKGVERRPQISNDIDDIDDIDSKHLSNHELDLINKIYHTETKKSKENVFLNMTIKEFINKNINFIINLNDEYSKKLNEISKTTTNQTKYIFALISHLNMDYNLIYFGMILILISIILYFFNITSS